MSGPATPVSPKVLLGAAWAFLAPMLVVAVAALLSYLLTDDGRALFNVLPVWAQVPILAFLSALSSAVGGYLARDRIREAGARQLQLDAAAVEDARADLLTHLEPPHQQAAAADPRDVDGDRRDDSTGRYLPKRKPGE